MVVTKVIGSSRSEGLDTIVSRFPFSLRGAEVILRTPNGTPIQSTYATSTADGFDVRDATPLCVPASEPPDHAPIVHLVLRY